MIQTQRYKIKVEGCDDSTIFSAFLTEEELVTVRMIAELCNSTSQSPCQPRIKIFDANHKEEDYLDD